MNRVLNYDGFKHYFTIKSFICTSYAFDEFECEHVEFTKKCK